MKTKQYAFTIAEMYAIRDALIEYSQMLRQAKCDNKLTTTVHALKDQFKDDVRLWRD